LTTLQLQFQDDAGLVVVQLTGTDGNLLEYVPNHPVLRKSVITRLGIDGGEQLLADMDNVDETIVAHMTGGMAAIRAAISRLDNLFRRARQYRELKGVLPIWIKFRPDTAEALYRSQVLSGRVIWDPLTLGWMWANGKVHVQIVFTRRHFWETDAEAEIPLSLATGTPSYVTGGVGLRDHEDATGGHSNAVEINAGGITGDLPAPPRIVLQNLLSPAQTYANFYVSHEIEYVAAMAVVQEGEAAAGITSSQADALSSGGNFGRCTWSGSAQADLAIWNNLTSAVLNAAAGRFFRALIRFASAMTYTDLWLMLKLTTSAGTVFQTPKVLMKSASIALQELGSLQLPPYLIGSANLDTVNVVLSAIRAGGGSSTIDVDFIQYLALDGWRKLLPVAGGLGQNESLVDDMTNDLVYKQVGGLNQKNYAVYGQPLKLEPVDYKQRIRVLWTRLGGSAVVDDTLWVRAYYRPRRLSL
jgi:hypothetical protein